jgi:cytochrome c553
MKKRLPLIAGLALVVAGMMSVDMAAAAGKGNWKRGRVYFRMVCTACHVEMTGNAVSPNTRTIAEWSAYMDADTHDASGKTKPKVADYVSKEYRESIKDSNKAAKKFLKLPDDALFEDVKAFLEHGAKDSDTPASCG